MVSIGILGINHKLADLSLREEIAKAGEKLKGERSLFFSCPTVLLSTCNRTEIYFSSDNLAEAHSELLYFLRSFMPFPFEHFLYSYFKADAFFHLCKVTSGLDSAVFLETEIQGQVKRAYQEARFLSSELHYAFQKALKVGKNIRTKMQVGKRANLYHTLWKLGIWKSSKILLVGYSEINRGLISFLRHKEVENVTLSTRSFEQIQLPGIQVVGRDVLPFWPSFDIIVCGVKSDAYLIDGEGSGKNVIFDLSLPRGVNPDTNATVYNIEELHKRVQKEFSDKEEEAFEVFVRENAYRLYRAYLEKTAAQVQEITL